MIPGHLLSVSFVSLFIHCFPGIMYRSRHPFWFAIFVCFGTGAQFSAFFFKSLMGCVNSLASYFLILDLIIAQCQSLILDFCDTVGFEASRFVVGLAKRFAYAVFSSEQCLGNSLLPLKSC
jgi:hypothetical protein